MACDPSGLKFIQLFPESVSAFDLHSLDCFELLKQRAGCIRVVFKALKAKDEFSLPSNVLFAEGHMLLGLDKPRFEFLPIHVEILAGPTGFPSSRLIEQHHKGKVPIG